MNDNNCPLCGGQERSLWASENGHDVVRCKTCFLLYVYPMPHPSVVDTAVKTGLQKSCRRTVNVRGQRIPSKVKRYIRHLKPMLQDIISPDSPVTWVDVGCGYGEFMEALKFLLPAGSSIIGIEPMTHKAEVARAFGLDVVNGYLGARQFEADFISNIDVFSHIPDYRGFLAVVASKAAQLFFCKSVKG
jgi:SAM-dependent methyltransferase